MYFRLTDRYKHVLSHPGWLAADVLLKHTKQSFPDMKSTVLSRIMKFTFPECRKVINKYGYFYAGLLPKPDVSISSSLLTSGVEFFQRVAMHFWFPNSKMSQKKTPKECKLWYTVKLL